MIWRECCDGDNVIERSRVYGELVFAEPFSAVLRRASDDQGGWDIGLKDQAALAGGVEATAKHIGRLFLVGSNRSDLACMEAVDVLATVEDLVLSIVFGQPGPHEVQ